jgi:hypothetical protein
MQTFRFQSRCPLCAFLCFFLPSVRFRTDKPSAKS